MLHDAFVRRRTPLAPDFIRPLPCHISALARLRREAEREIERLLTLLDALDGDPDMEPDTPFEDDAGDTAELEHNEPDLSSTPVEDQMGFYAPTDDLECDAGDEMELDADLEPEVSWIAGGDGNTAMDGPMPVLNWCRAPIVQAAR